MSAVAEDISQYLAFGPTRMRAKLPTTALGFDAYLRSGIANKVGRSVASQLGLGRKAFARLLHISPSTLDRRNDAKAPFRGSEADALYRVLRVLGVAWRVLGSETNVRTWMRRTQPGLGGRVPLELMQTEAGADAVCLLLEQIHHGIVP